MKVIKEPRVELLWSTPDPRRVISIAARMTYSARPVETLRDDLHEEEITRSVNAILERRHWSVLRHVVFMFTISGVSRAFSHQMVRHNVGHSYEQRSQHYRTEKDFNLVMPDLMGNSYHDLGEGNEIAYQVAAGNAQHTYDELMSRGVSKDNARFILPNGVETQMVWTANLEAILNFVQTRACVVNTPEITKVAVAVRKLVIPEVPEVRQFLGPTCLTQGICYEGPKYETHCNKPWQTPTVHWSPDFPKVIELVGVDGYKETLRKSSK